MTNEHRYISEKVFKRELIKDMRSFAIGQPKDYFTGVDVYNDLSDTGASMNVEFRPMKGTS